MCNIWTVLFYRVKQLESKKTTVEPRLSEFIRITNDEIKIDFVIRKDVKHSNNKFG